MFGNFGYEEKLFYQISSIAIFLINGNEWYYAIAL
jgi:hypothetical protein